jgi:uncharacterized protein (UPF0335 family)
MNQDYITDAEYAQIKQIEYKRKKLREQVKNNAKSARGFGYEYKPVQFDYPQE